MNHRNFKDSTKAAAAYLAEHGIEVSQTRLLEALSRAFGERNWSTMLATLKASPAAVAAQETEVPAWSIAQGPMTDGQFAQAGGALCPFCGSDDVEADTVEADGPMAWDNSDCNGCSATWKTAYRVVGFFDAEAGSAPVTAVAPPDLAREYLDQQVAKEMKRYADLMGVDATGSAIENASPKSQSTSLHKQRIQAIASMPKTMAVVLVANSAHENNALCYVFRAHEALPVLAQNLADDDSAVTVESILHHSTGDYEENIKTLFAAGVHPLETVRRDNAEYARHAAISRASERFGLTVLYGFREEVVADIADDVFSRGRKYGYKAQGVSQATELARESAAVLGYDDVTEDEIFEAACRIG